MQKFVRVNYRDEGIHSYKLFYGIFNEALMDKKAKTPINIDLMFTKTQCYYKKINIIVLRRLLPTKAGSRKLALEPEKFTYTFMYTAEKQFRILCFQNKLEFLKLNKPWKIPYR